MAVTKKIPIEIILEGDSIPDVPDTPEVPDVPDVPPTPEEPTDGTDIIVPSTGTISKNDGFSTGLMAVSGMFAFFMVALLIFTLIRKHKKLAKESKEEKQSENTRLSIVTAGTLSIIAVTALITQLVLSAVQPALSSAIDGEGEGAIEFYPYDQGGKVTITATRTEEEDTVLAKVARVGEVLSDSQYGYEVLVSTENAKLCLEDDATKCINPTTGGTLANNTWGYNRDDSDTYVAVSSEPAVVERFVVEPAGTWQRISYIYYAVKVDKRLPAGTYKGEIEFTIQPLEPLADFPEDLVYMQDMTGEICRSVVTPNAFKEDGVTIEDNVPTTTLIDNRGENPKSYTIAKLADGNCWMTQNLDLDIDKNTTYTHANTDLGWGEIGYNDEQHRDTEATWEPVASTRTDEDGGWENVQLSLNEASLQSYDPGSKYWDGTTFCDEDQNTYEVTCPENKNPVSTNGNSHYHLGNYYNYAAARAINNPQNHSSTVANRTNSICPAGWTLPARYLSPYTDEPELDDIANLSLVYGLNNKSARVIAGAPFYFNLSGWAPAPSGAAIDRVGVHGVYWWSYMGDYGNFVFNATYNNIAGLRNTILGNNFGFPVRCRARIY